MNKKGFTIIELLAVLIVLAIVSLITTIIVSSILKDTKESLSDRQKENIEKAAEAYYLKEGMNYSDTCVNVQELIDKGYFDVATITDPKNREGMSGSVEIIYESNHHVYKYQEEICKTICVAVETATTGNIPQGNYTYGDEYTCILADGVSRTFFVLEDGDTTTLSKGTTGSAGAGEVALIMDSNFADATVPKTLKWCLDGGTTVTCQNISSKEEGTPLKYIQNTFGNNIIVSFPTYEQIYAVNNSDDFSNEKWLYDYLYNTIHPVSDLYGYWTTSHYNTNSIFIRVSNVCHEGGLETTIITTDDYAGLRPIITVPKSELK